MSRAGIEGRMMEGPGDPPPIDPQKALPPPPPVPPRGPVAPGLGPRPGPRPGPGRRPKAPAPIKRPPWGWLEWFVVSQTAIPALVFLPGVTSLRAATRVAAFVVALVAWWSIARSSKGANVGARFAPVPWLLFCLGWLTLSIFNPNTNSPVAGVAQVALYLTVMSPAFWAPRALLTARQLPRLMVVLFVCNSASALMGLAQSYSPRFNPPHILALEHEGAAGDMASGALTFEAADGRRIIRPCGLTDNPGAANGPAIQVCLFGLCLALRPIPLTRRAAGFGMALVGMAVIYYTQIRTAMVTELICIFTLIALFSMRGNARQAAQLAAGSAIVMVAGAAWVVSNVGMVGIERFGTLVTQSPGEVYKGRGSFVEQTFTTQIWDSPLGDGLGRYGQIHTYFGQHGMAEGSPGGPVWIEVQWPGWALDGGIPLIVAYTVAIALALADSARIALKSRDRELAYWAAVVFAMNLGTFGMCFSQYPFIAANGMQFWLLAAALHAADRRSKVAAAKPPPPRPRPGARPA